VWWQAIKNGAHWCVRAAVSRLGLRRPLTCSGRGSALVAELHSLLTVRKDNLVFRFQQKPMAIPRLRGARKVSCAPSTLCLTISIIVINYNKYEQISSKFLVFLLLFYSSPWDRKFWVEFTDAQIALMTQKVDSTPNLWLSRPEVFQLPYGAKIREWGVMQNMRIIQRLILGRETRQSWGERGRLILWLLGFCLPENRALHICAQCLRQLASTMDVCKCQKGAEPMLVVLHPNDFVLMDRKGRSRAWVS